jgi:hypothetical protein
MELVNSGNRYYNILYDIVNEVMLRLKGPRANRNSEGITPPED